MLRKFCAALAMVTLLTASACKKDEPNPNSASQSTPASARPLETGLSAGAQAGGAPSVGDAAAPGTSAPTAMDSGKLEPGEWCAAVVNLAERHELIVNKRFRRAAIPNATRPFALEALRKKQEFLDKAPAELRSAVISEFSYLQRLSTYGEQHGWGPGPNTPKASPREKQAEWLILKDLESRCGIETTP